MIKYETILSKNCKAFTDKIDPDCLSYINRLLNSEIGRESIIRIMPNTHTDSGIITGLSMMTRDKISPILLGDDIGCGVFAVKLTGRPKIKLEKLDNVVESVLRYGSNIRSEGEKWIREYVFSRMKCQNFDTDEALRSIGTLGGRGHFIELGVSEDSGVPEYWLVVHGGSGDFGRAIADHYKNEAIAQHPEVPQEFSYLSGSRARDFSQDTARVCNFASMSCDILIKRICLEMGWVPSFNKLRCDHNSIKIATDAVVDDQGTPVLYYHLRKGCIRACNHDQVIIPISMKEGCIIGFGKSNSNWNNSAPSGSARILARDQARSILTLNQYNEEMKGIHSSSISYSTIGDSPMVYESMDYLNTRIKDTIEVSKIVKPIYNFKVEEE